MMQRANCPTCQKPLPWLIFRGDRRVRTEGGEIYFRCPRCKKVQKAISNEAHQRNFVWIFLIPLFATPMIFALQQFFPSPYKAFYFLFCYILAIFIPVLRGQHKMQFEAAAAENEDPP